MRTEADRFSSLAFLQASGFLECAQFTQLLSEIIERLQEADRRQNPDEIGLPQAVQVKLAGTTLADIVPGLFSQTIWL